MYKIGSITLAVMLSLTCSLAPVNAQEVVKVNCLGKLDQPHKSHHVPGTVNAQAKIRCGVVVLEIKGTVTLIRDDGVRSSSGIKTVRNKNNWKANASLPCDGRVHGYRSRVDVSWKSPAGAKPPAGNTSFEQAARFKC